MRQIDMFSEVLHSYGAAQDGTLANAELYAQVGKRAGLSNHDFERRVPVGASGQRHNLAKRSVRWFQQDLKRAGILEHAGGARGVWRLTTQASKDLNAIDSGVSVVGFSTSLGVAILGSCESVFSKIDAPIVLCITSPPYPLAKARNYGNPSEEHYIDWICRMLEPVIKNMVPGASMAINLSNVLPPNRKYYFLPTALFFAKNASKQVTLELEK